MKLSSEDVSYQTPPGLKGNAQVGHSASLSPLLKEKDKGDIGLLPRKVPVDPDVTLDHFFMNTILKVDLGPHRHQACWSLDLDFIVQPQEFCFSSIAGQLAMYCVFAINSLMFSVKAMVTYFCTKKKKSLRKAGGWQGHLGRLDNSRG